jgi:hypothetical protein
VRTFFIFWFEFGAFNIDGGQLSLGAQSSLQFPPETVMAKILDTVVVYAL